MLRAAAPLSMVTPMRETAGGSGWKIWIELRYTWDMVWDMVGIWLGHGLGYGLGYGWGYGWGYGLGYGWDVSLQTQQRTSKQRNWLVHAGGPGSLSSSEVGSHKTAEQWLLMYPSFVLIIHQYHRLACIAILPPCCIDFFPWPGLVTNYLHPQTLQVLP